jgi:hypothetical protein
VLAEGSPQRARRTTRFWHNPYYMFLSRLQSFPRWHPLCLLLVFGFFLVSARAQESAATVTFTLDFPGSEPSHYVISVSSDGHSSYVSDGKLNSQSESAPDDPWRLEFMVSQSANTRVFDLAQRSHYFEGQIDSRKKHLAFTGTKTLTYKDAQKSTRASYNYTPEPSVQELTSFFQSLSTTMEFGRRLDFYLRYQKLALDEELKRMEEMSKSGGLQEIAALSSVLQKIEEDPAVIKVVRARAQRLLQLAGTASK